MYLESEVNNNTLSVIIVVVVVAAKRVSADVVCGSVSLDIDRPQRRQIHRHCISSLRIQVSADFTVSPVPCLCLLHTSLVIYERKIEPSSCNSIAITVIDGALFDKPPRAHLRRTAMLIATTRKFSLSFVR